MSPSVALKKKNFFNQSIDKQTVATPLKWPIMAMLRKGECDVKKGEFEGVLRGA
jgi:hypothetical protein